MPRPVLPPPDGHHLDAALGWLALQLPGEALAELDHLQPEHRRHAAVLAVRFAALVHARRHAEARAVATEHSRLHPADSQGWINLANAHFWLDDAAAAHACAAARVDAFPDDWALPYNLACYSVKLAQLDEARRWLAEALRRGPAADILASALADPDLAPLHAELRVRQAALPPAK